MGTFPNAEALFDTLLPFSVIDFIIWPSEDSFPMGFVVQVLTNVLGLVGEKLVAAPITPIVLPLTLVNSTVVIDKHS